MIGKADVGIIPAKFGPLIIISDLDKTTNMWCDFPCKEKAQLLREFNYIITGTRFLL